MAFDDPCGLCGHIRELHIHGEERRKGRCRVAHCMCQEFEKKKSEPQRRTAAKRYPSEGHPWADFLHHRARVLEMWRREGYTPDQSARLMTMDPVQVRLILSTVASAPRGYPVPKEGG